MPFSYNLSQLWKGIKNPRRAALELYTIYQEQFNKPPGVNIVEENWDNLIILDACRFDTFKKINSLDGTLQKERSRGSNTVDFLKRNFGRSEFPDIVYVSANPNISYIDARFYDRIRLWESHWNDELNVVPPEAVATMAAEAAVKYPNKRLIIHFMQPHFPFIGDFGQKLYDNGVIQHYSSGRDFWKQLQRDDVAEEDFRRAYQENLEVVLPAVEQLIENLRGQTVVTSDHGNEFGRWGIYGHPGVFSHGLRDVPWLITPQSSEKEVISGEANVGPEDSDALQEKLAALGYK
jgi:hypothetical protein